MSVSPESAVKVWTFLWPYRLIFGLRRITEEERESYRHFLVRNRESWEEFLKIKKDSEVYRFPLDIRARPLIGTAISAEYKSDLEIQDRLWKYRDDLYSTLKKYDRSEGLISRFTLLIKQTKGLTLGGKDCEAGFQRHDELLKWMIGRPLWSDVTRKLAVLHRRREEPQFDD